MIIFVLLKFINFNNYNLFYFIIFNYDECFVENKDLLPMLLIFDTDNFSTKVLHSYFGKFH